ncbi:hypothetical protein DES52_1022 [Deinococcus yavapaiensis KR-236]|uniref:Dolichyl-phosphate-mannose-protein mannosyltransferase n=2 Tax=Deinococcus TaxID=1298 RepID=A0A318S9T7_9DEIO|nr:hypothetical protein DES52_1022 [Deinococcus yavapaiensis KR-236]
MGYKSQHAYIIIFLALSIGAYYCLRYLGLWAENDTASFATSINEVITFHKLVYRGAYTHGYGYQVWATTLYGFTGIDPQTLLQIYGPMIGTIFMSLFGFALYRIFFQKNSLATAAVISLFLVPELLFTVLRGNHEKLTISLTLLSVAAVISSFRAMHDMSRRGVFLGWVITYYATSFCLVSLNVFFGSTFIVSSTLALLLLSLASRIFPRRLKIQPRFQQRLTLSVAASWIIVALIAWYAYPAAGSNLSLLKTAIEKVGTLFLSFTPESNPYTTITSDWASSRIYLWLSSFRWLLFLGSFVGWILAVRTLWRGGEGYSQRLMLMTAFYAATTIQLAFAVIIDLVGLAAGTNLQVRLYTYFTIFAAPMFVFALSRVGEKIKILRPSLAARRYYLTFIAVLFFIVPSLLKATLEPYVSNRWLSYAPEEIIALRFWKSYSAGTDIWIGLDARLRYAAALEMPNPGKIYNFKQGARMGDAPLALVSRQLNNNNLAWGVGMPFSSSMNTLYDNGDAAILIKSIFSPFD